MTLAQRDTASQEPQLFCLVALSQPSLELPDFPDTEEGRTCQCALDTLNKFDNELMYIRLQDMAAYLVSAHIINFDDLRRVRAQCVDRDSNRIIISIIKAHIKSNKTTEAFTALKNALARTEIYNPLVRSLQTTFDEKVQALSRSEFTAQKSALSHEGIDDATASSVPSRSESERVVRRSPRLAQYASDARHDQKQP
ncbi:hypothetical protein [Sansalvadorimonas verongulae]|uniref:hypothetical protein n=1 Tax=Sansalvadorimonas verongulae TaxID=2172824 RepID=UPI0012BB573F|nr:hypothetical protein [Sansalvadorimonas verongulae]MTI12720.1 hypothetical protein [Sansalvadorimonas verongulae]